MKLQRKIEYKTSFGWVRSSILWRNETPLIKKKVYGKKKMFLVAFFTLQKVTIFVILTKTERDEERFDEERFVHPSDAYLLINPNLTLRLFFIIGYSIYFIFEGKKDKISRQKRLSFCHFHYFWIGYR